MSTSGFNVSNLAQAVWADIGKIEKDEVKRSGKIDVNGITKNIEKGQGDLNTVIKAIKEYKMPTEVGEDEKKVGYLGVAIQRWDKFSHLLYEDRVQLRLVTAKLFGGKPSELGIRFCEFLRTCWRYVSTFKGRGAIDKILEEAIKKLEKKPEEALAIASSLVNPNVIKEVPFPIQQEVTKAAEAVKTNDPMKVDDAAEKIETIIGKSEKIVEQTPTSPLPPPVIPLSPQKEVAPQVVKVNVTEIYGSASESGKIDPEKQTKLEGFFKDEKISIDDKVRLIVHAANQYKKGKLDNQKTYTLGIAQKYRDILGDSDLSDVQSKLSGQLDKQSLQTDIEKIFGMK